MREREKKKFLVALASVNHFVTWNVEKSRKKKKKSLVFHFEET